MTGLRVGKGMLFWISVNGVVKHGGNHQRINGERVERIHGLWKLLHGPQSCNVFVIWKTSRAKDYRPESAKLNHNEIYVTQENVLLDKTKPTETLLQEVKATKERKDRFGLEDNIQVCWRLMADGGVRIQRNVHGKDHLFQKKRVV